MLISSWYHKDKNDYCGNIFPIRGKLWNNFENIFVIYKNSWLISMHRAVSVPAKMVSEWVGDWSRENSICLYIFVIIIFFNPLTTYHFIFPNSLSLPSFLIIFFLFFVLLPFVFILLNTLSSHSSVSSIFILLLLSHPFHVLSFSPHLFSLAFLFFSLSFFGFLSS